MTVLVVSLWDKRRLPDLSLPDGETGEVGEVGVLEALMLSFSEELFSKAAEV